LESNQAKNKNSVYLNQVQFESLQVNPNELVDLIGRGTGKSPIQAVRAHYAATTMPKASGAFIGPSYVNIMERTLPPVERFWQEFFKWEEGKHYVKFKKPPAHWPKPLTPPSDYKHVITIYTGFVFYLGSLDRPGILNSLSLQYYTLDEGRFANYERLTKDLMPAVRGDVQRFGRNPLYLGRTITSDLPFIEDNAEWLYGLEKRMNKGNVEKILQFERKISSLKKKLLEAIAVVKQERLKARIAKLTLMANIIRRKTTYFKVASSLANRFVLGLDYFRKNSDPAVTPKHVFRTSYLSIKPRSVESMFYGKMVPRHWYTGVFNYTILDKLWSKKGINAKRNCSSDDDLDRRKGLVCGVDWGNMVSMSIGQKEPFGLNEFRTAKFLYALTPQDMDDLADAFTTYYAAYPTKKLRMHYDRTGNVKLENSKKTKAQHFADRVRSKGWEVELMSKGMGNIPHPLKHLLFSRMFAEEDLETYPVLRSNRDNCRELHSSMNLAPAINKSDEIFKDKKSENLRPLTRLPMESTNPSDSWDYMIWGEYRHTITKASRGAGYTRQKQPS
jgi:hypothetical protein